MNTTEKIVDQLFVLARDSQKYARARICAAVVHNRRIVSYGFNQERTNILQRRFKKNIHAEYLHAEIDAIKNAIKCSSYDVIKNSTLYVVRAKVLNGEFIKAESKPCVGCKSCIEFHNMKKMVYICDTGEITMEKVR